MKPRRRTGVLTLFQCSQPTIMLTAQMMIIREASIVPLEALERTAEMLNPV